MWLSPASEEDPRALAQTLPEPHTIPGALLVLGPAPSGGLLSRIFGRETTLPRPVRGAALLLRGYQDVGGGFDAKSGLDLCWATAPPRAPGA